MAISMGLIGTALKSVSAITPVPPTLTVGATPDIMYAWHVSNNQPDVASGSPSVISAAAGFVEVEGSPKGYGTAGGTSAIRVSLFAKRVVTTGDTGPTFVACSAGAGAGIFTVKGVAATAPLWHKTAGDITNGATATISVPGFETTLADCLVFDFIADHIDSGVDQTDPATFANASLGAFAELLSFRANAIGNGCGIAIYSGTKAVAGTVSPTTGQSILVSGVRRNLHQARFKLAVSSNATGGVAASDFNCSGWCAAPVGPAPTPDHRHWHGESGAPFTQVSGGWRSAPVDSDSSRWRNISGTDAVARFYLTVPNLPDRDCVLFRFVTSNGQSPEIRFEVATSEFFPAIGTTLGTGVLLVPGKKYLIDARGLVGTGTRAFDMKVDGFDKSITRAVTAGTLTRIEMGASVGAPATAVVEMRVIRFGTNAASYPFGAAHSFGWQVRQDGTHNYNAAGDFKYEDGSNVPLAVTDSWARLAGLLDDASTWFGRGTAAVTEYLEHLPAAGIIPPTTAIFSAEIVTVYLGQDANANAVTDRLVSGGSSVDFVAGYNFPGPGPYIHSKHLTLDPTGVAMTTALMQAWKFRTGLSATGLWAKAGQIVEVDCTLTTPPSDTETTEPNPMHTYPGPGTYHPTLEVTDNDGLTGLVTKTVVIV